MDVAPPLPAPLTQEKRSTARAKALLLTTMLKAASQLGLKSNAIAVLAILIAESRPDSPPASTWSCRITAQRLASRVSLTKGHLRRSVRQLRDLKFIRIASNRARSIARYTLLDGPFGVAQHTGHAQPPQDAALDTLPQVADLGADIERSAQPEGGCAGAPTPPPGGCAGAPRVGAPAHPLSGTVFRKQKQAASSSRDGARPSFSAAGEPAAAAVQDEETGVARAFQGLDEVEAGGVRALLERPTWMPSGQAWFSVQDATARVLEIRGRLGPSAILPSIAFAYDHAEQQVSRGICITNPPGWFTKMLRIVTPQILSAWSREAVARRPDAPAPAPLFASPDPAAQASVPAVPVVPVVPVAVRAPLPPGIAGDVLTRLRAALGVERCARYFEAGDHAAALEADGRGLRVVLASEFLARTYSRQFGPLVHAAVREATGRADIAVTFVVSPTAPGVAA